MLHHCLDEINANTLLDTYKCKDLLFSKFPVVLMLSNLFYTAIKTTGVHTASVELVANHRAYKLATAVGISYQCKENSPAQLSPTTLHTCE